MINKVILIGNLGKDPEVFTFDNGDKQAKFTLATTEQWKDKDGNKHKNTEWHNIVFNKGIAGVCESYLKKGSKIYLEGKIHYGSYEKDGATKYFTEIRGSVMNMLGDSNQGEQQQNNSSKQNAPQQGSSVPSDSEDLPF